jgi:hypothetical protein
MLLHIHQNCPLHSLCRCAYPLCSDIEGILKVGFSQFSVDLLLSKFILLGLNFSNCFRHSS